MYLPNTNQIHVIFLFLNQFSGSSCLTWCTLKILPWVLAISFESSSTQHEQCHCSVFPWHYIFWGNTSPQWEPLQLTRKVFKPAVRCLCRIHIPPSQKKLVRKKCVPVPWQKHVQTWGRAASLEAPGHTGADLCREELPLTLPIHQLRSFAGYSNSRRRNHIHLLETDIV